MKHRIVGNVSGIVDDKDGINDNNPVVIEYEFEDYEPPIHITQISVYGAYPNLIRSMDPNSLRSQVEASITNIEGDNVDFKFTTVTIL